MQLSQDRNGTETGQKRDRNGTRSRQCRDTKTYLTPLFSMIVICERSANAVLSQIPDSRLQTNLKKEKRNPTTRLRRRMKLSLFRCGFLLSKCAGKLGSRLLSVGER